MSRTLKQSYNFWIGSLSFTAGFINILSLLYYTQVITHYTGHLSLLATNLATGNVAQAIMHLQLIVFFVMGGITSGLIFQTRVFDLKRRYGIILFILGLIYIVVVQFWSKSHFMHVYIAYMIGIQNSLFIYYRGTLVRTTHFSGYLTDLGVEIGRYIRGHHDSTWKIVFYLSNIALFIIGGMSATWGYHDWRTGIVFVPGGLYLFLGSYYFYYRHLYLRLHQKKESLSV